IPPTRPCYQRQYRTALVLLILVFKALSAAFCSPNAVPARRRHRCDGASRLEHLAPSTIHHRLCRSWRTL
uniref:Uncharacterized protein n=1 Tax=Denticeps clupeoides TaxID=299321 RepID=A0AAY3ZT84_9TELE